MNELSPDERRIIRKQKDKKIIITIISIIVGFLVVITILSKLFPIDKTENYDNKTVENKSEVKQENKINYDSINAVNKKKADSIYAVKLDSMKYHSKNVIMNNRALRIMENWKNSLSGLPKDKKTAYSNLLKKVYAFQYPFIRLDFYFVVKKTLQEKDRNFDLSISGKDNSVITIIHNMFLDKNNIYSNYDNIKSKLIEMRFKKAIFKFSSFSDGVTFNLDSKKDNDIE